MGVSERTNKSAVGGWVAGVWERTLTHSLSLTHPLSLTFTHCHSLTHCRSMRVWMSEVDSEVFVVNEVNVQFAFYITTK